MNELWQSVEKRHQKPRTPETREQEQFLDGDVSQLLAYGGLNLKRWDGFRIELIAPHIPVFASMNAAMAAGVTITPEDREWTGRRD